MSTNLLRVEPNQRVDYNDFDYLINESITGAMRDVANTFLLNPDGPAAERMRIIDGFEMVNPGGTKQLTVSLGRALLAERIRGVINYGAIVSTGSASQTIDMTALAPATYGIYIRFEYVDAASASRVFWNPGGAGTEFTQNISTRRNAAWSVRVELASPGSEWLQIGTADNSGVGVVIVDQRDLYFEGPIADSYESGWSSEGGGVANDRNADRKQYGVKDLQTFTAAMRQCLEDIRGRGLRRWYEKGIGGLNVGFDTDPEEDQLHVGNSDFGLEFDGTDPHLVFDDDRRDEIWFDRSAENYYFKIDAVNRMILTGDGLQVNDGIRVGSTGTPFNDDFHAPSGGINCGGVTNPTAGDGIFTRGVKVGNDTGLPKDNCFTAPDGGINCGGAATPATGDGIFTSGVVVGYDAAPIANQVRVGVEDFRLVWSGIDPQIWFDTTGGNDYLAYDRSADNWSFIINGVSEALIGTDGVRVLNGLYVGGLGTAATDNEIRAEGAIHSGGRQFYFGVGSDDYISHNDTNNEFYFVDDGTIEVKIGAPGVNILNGLVVGNTTTAPTDNDIYCEGTIDCLGDLTPGSITMSGNIYTTGQIGRDSTDYIDWQGDGYMRFVTNNVEEMRLDADGLRVLNGIFVGTIAGPATDNDIYAEGSIACGTTIDAVGDATFGTITMTGFSVDADGDVVGKTIQATGGPQLTATGIAQAEAITGATSIDGTGDLTMGTITMTGFSVDADGDTSMKTLSVENLSVSDAQIGEFYDSRNASVKEYWIDFDSDTSTGTRFTPVRMVIGQLGDVVFGSGNQGTFDLQVTRWGTSISTVFNVANTGEFSGFAYNFGLPIGSSLNNADNACNWVGLNQRWVFSSTASASVIDKEISFSVPPRAGISGKSVTMITMENSSSANWVKIGGGANTTYEDGATAVSIYVAPGLGQPGALAQSYNSSGLNNCFDRFFYSAAGIQLNNDSSQTGAGTGQLVQQGQRLRFFSGPGEGLLHVTQRTIDADLHFTGIGVSKVYKYLNPMIFDTDRTSDGDTVYVMIAGWYTNGSSTQLTIGLTYEPDPVGAAGTYQDLIYKTVNLDTAGRFIIEAWITCRSSGNARYVARIQDAGSNQKVEFLTSDIAWDHTKQKKFYLIASAIGEDRTIDVDNGILCVT